MNSIRWLGMAALAVVFLVTLSGSAWAAAPVAVRDTVTMLEDNVDTTNVIANDTDPENNINPLSTAFVTAPTNGVAATIDIAGVRQIAYTPLANFVGVDSLEYRITDSTSASASAWFVITILPVPDLPVAVRDLDTTDESTPITIDVLANDSDVDGDMDPLSTLVATAPANGTTVIDTVGGVAMLRYTPNTSFTGLDSTQYSVADTIPGLDSAWSVVLVQARPVANPDTVTTPEDTPIAINVLANDTDADGDMDSTTVAVTAGPSSGGVAINPTTGVITYTPGQDYNGPDTIAYTVMDQQGGLSNTAIVFITVTPVNDPPAPVDDAATTNEGVAVIVDVLANDPDPDVDGDPIDPTSVVASDPPFGTTVVDSATGAVTYTPDPNFNGTDTFTYTVDDTTGMTSPPATVTITVLSDGIMAIDTFFYQWANICPSACDAADSTMSLGDSIRVTMVVNAADVDEIASGWPKAFLKELGGSSAGNQLIEVNGDTTAFHLTLSLSDSSWFLVKAGSWPIDVGAGFYDITGDVKSSVSSTTTSDTAQVLSPIDTRMPVDGSGAPVWELYYDANDDNIAAVGDSMRFYLDLTNEPFGEICQVTLTLWGGWGNVPLTLMETAGDRRFELIYEIAAGNIDTTTGPTHATQFIFTDNACNTDSVGATYTGQIDNRGPSTALPFTFERLLDADSNNCMGIGDQVRIRLTDTVNVDVNGFFADLLNAGLGVADTADTSHYRYAMTETSPGSNVWGIDWTLAPYPLDRAVDIPASDDTIWVSFADDAGNADTIPIVWTDGNPLITSIDTEVPNPVTIDSCWSTFAGGERVVHFAWSGQASDAAWFRIFWDDASGTVSYTDTLAGHFDPSDSSWSTDGTVTVSACRDYTFNIWTVDDCGNLELTHPSEIFCEGNTPNPISDLSCATLDSLVLGLDWKATDHSVAGHVIYMGRDGVIDYDNPVDTVSHTSPDTLYAWTTAEANSNLPTIDELGWYDFAVWTYDTCGNFELTHADSCQVLADSRPAEVCIFQPDTVSCYSADMHVYVCPKTDGDKDVVSVTARGRLADSGSGFPGPWVTLGAASESNDETCFDVTLSSSGLNGLVGSDTTKTIELVFTTVDEAGRVLTDSAAYVACVFTFDWSTMVPTVEITTVNGNLATYQPFCDFHGYLVEGLPAQTIDFCIDGGNPPYTIQIQIDDDGNTGSNDEVYYAQGVTDLCHTIPLDLTGWSKGEGTFFVEVIDRCGNSTTDEVSVCIADIIPSCGIVSNPVDGKCIRRSRSLLDAVTPICVTIDPLQNCLDPNGVLKVDFQWAQQCCDDIDTVGWTYFTSLDTTSVDPGAGSCDTTWFPPPFDTLIQEIVCDSALSDTTRWVLDSFPNVFTCDTLWSTFSLVSGVDIVDGVVCTEWMNKDDLAWITQSGTNIFLRAVIWDDHQNMFITECVQVCVDIDTPPLCISSPDICEVNGVSKISGLIDIFASLDISGTGVNYDDLEDVTLWYKRSTDADRIENWNSVGSGFLGAGGDGGNSTVWRWDDFNTNNLVKQTNYDWRVIAKTIWGWTSYDLNGDGDFDSETFDANACDMTTWFVDNDGSQISIDTVWTTVVTPEGTEEIVQPNVSCTLSDPRGWLWAQYGQDIRIQPAVYPLGEMGDVVKVEWTLWDGDCSSCACDTAGPGSPEASNFSETDCDHKVVRINEGADAMNDLVFNPADVPFVTVVDGYQSHVLRVRAWDACGNVTEDCVTIHLLDINPTDAIVITPMNEAVFCQDHDDLQNNPGGIDISARTLLNETFKKATFYYRAQGDATWIEIGVVEAGGMGTNGDLSITWYPHALGLADGAYELTVRAEDYSGNVQGDANLYVTTVFFSCAAPTVTMTAPVEGQQVGTCELELSATATGAPNNPIESVCFYVQDITSGSATQIGCDNYSTGTTYNFNWDPTSDPDDDGRFYLFAVATNRAGVSTQSPMVMVQIDDVSPWARIIEVNGDGSDGGSGDPTTVVAGTGVTIAALARDRSASEGYGQPENCGVDSVLIYVINSSDLKVFGATMSVSPTVDSLFNLSPVWATGDLPNGAYRVYAEAYDCGCNKGTSSYWYVNIVNPTPAGTIAINEAIDNCGYPSIVDDSININLTPSGNTDIASVVIWVSANTNSDVYDQYFKPSPNNGVLTLNSSGVWVPIVDFGTASWSEGLYRVRAVITTSQGAVSDDYTGDGKFDDFTFDPDNNPHHMWLMVDRSVTPFTVALDASTISSGTDVGVTVTPTEECDAATVCYGVVAQNGNAVDKYCGPERTYNLDPIDSGLVSMNHGVWHGPVRVTVSDALGNSSTWIDSDNLYVLDITGDNAALVSPAWGEYVTGTSVSLAARKLTSGSVSEVEFFYGDATGAGTSIDTDNSASGDEFSVAWDISGMSDGTTYLWVEADGAESRRVPVTIVVEPTGIVLNTPLPNYTRTVFNEDLTFVGGRVDVCLDASTVNAELLDSVVFSYRFGDAPGVPAQPDPDLGWVRIDADRYGSLCVDWFTELQGDVKGCFDGRYALAAWVYYRAGVVNHSNLIHVMVDNTDPYTEIVDIDGDETFGDCHVVELTDPEQRVTFKAVAIDDRSCVGPDAEFNSGAKYLQFFVGDCEGTVSGCVDIVWAVDGSGSMGDDQAQISAQAANFFVGLGNLDFRMGVLAYTENSNPVGTDGIFKAGGAGMGEFTSDLATFQTMITAVGDTGSGTENGLNALTDALAWYPWRSGCSKVLILVTDEDADDISSFATLQPPLVTSGAQISTVINFGDSTGYSTLSPLTNGAQLDITSSWGANLTALASQISGGGAAGGDVGIIWGKQMTLVDGQADAYAYWDPTGVPTGTYCAWTVVTDEVGNSFTSNFRQVCIIDQTPPVGQIAGFGHSADCCDEGYTIYGRSCDSDIDHVQFQWRESSSTVEADWTGIGLARMVGGDSTLWMTTWNPCLRTNGSYDIRMVPTDKSGNENFDIQPAVTVTITDCVVTPESAPSPVTVAFEDRTFENLGLVDVTSAEAIACHTMIGVYADLNNALDVEKVTLWQDLGDAAHYMGSFDDSFITEGGTGTFWAGYTTGLKTYLGSGMITVYHVDPAVGFPGVLTDALLGAKVELDPGALATENGVVLFPARMPRLSLSQQHFQAWGYKAGYGTAVRLTTPVDGGFRTGKYAEITVSIDSSALAAAGLTPSDLAPAWWEGDHWNITDDMIAGGEIGWNSATFLTSNLHGIYAVVSSGRECNSGALTVSVSPFDYGYASSSPTIRATVKSNIEDGNGNPDINPNEITVTLDGTVIYSNGDVATGWTVTWDNTSGALVVRWNGAPSLSGGSHNVTVLAFNKTGYCNRDSFDFDVDASEPNVDVMTEFVCTNPCFWFTIADMGSGVNWDQVYIDVYDITGSEFDVVPADKLIHTETPDAWDDLSPWQQDTVKFCLTDLIEEGRRLRIVIYNGERTWVTSGGDDGEHYWRYDHVNDGVPDLAGNNTEIVEEDYTVRRSACDGGMDDGSDITAAGNPFDPYSGGAVTFSMNGYGSGGGTVTMTVYDLTGERVLSRTYDGGGTMSWSGVTDKGDVVAEGVYLVHFRRTGSAAGVGSQALKVVVKRAD